MSIWGSFRHSRLKTNSYIKTVMKRRHSSFMIVHVIQDFLYWYLWMFSCENYNVFKGYESYHNTFNKYRYKCSIVCFKMFFALESELDLLSKEILGLVEVKKFICALFLILLSKCFQKVFAVLISLFCHYLVRGLDLNTILHLIIFLHRFLRWIKVYFY